MASKKTALSQLNDAISGILNEYAEDVGGNLSVIVEQMGKKGVKALKQSSQEKLNAHTDKYARGWKMQIEKGRMRTTVTIYNEHPSLPHLLEHGHVTRNGTGRVYAPTPAHEHIKPVEEKLVETFEREVMNKL